MLSPEAILALLSARWRALLRAEAAGASAFPLRVPFGKPTPQSDFALLQSEIAALAAAPLPWTIEWGEVSTRRWGRQRWPVRVTFDSLDAVAAALGRSLELERFRAALAHSREQCPALEPWLQHCGDRILDHLEIWPGLLSVCRVFDQNPRPHCFPRQIPAPVSTKFIEQNTGILRSLLDCVLGDRAQLDRTGFYQRFHLRTEPPAIRFRFLDPALQQSCGWPAADCSISVPDFANLQGPIPRVLIVENRDVFLCLPVLPRTLAVFGSGKAAALLPLCGWLEAADLLYWGDCDEAGYGILSALRARFPALRSLLMDASAWTQWQHLAVPGRRDPSATHKFLTPSERAALATVQAGPWMLEQERIPPAAAEAALRVLLAENQPASLRASP